MGDFFKEFFKGTGEKLRSPQVLGLIAMILLIFRFILSVEFSTLLIAFTSGLGKLKFIINIFQLFSLMLFITSVIAFICLIFFTFYYFILEIIYDSKKTLTKKQIDKSDTIHRFSLGSKIAILNVNMWMFVMFAYFFIFDEISFYKYSYLISNFIMQSNTILKFFYIVYGAIAVYTFAKLLKRMLYKFLYFKLDEETEKLLYEAKSKYFS